MDENSDPARGLDVTEGEPPQGVDIGVRWVKWDDPEWSHYLRPRPNGGPARLLDKESTTQRPLRSVLSDLGEAYRWAGVRDARGWCESPLPLYPRYAPGLGRWLLLIVPCRRCSGCRRSKQRDWANRALTEIASSERTWLVTFTLGNEARAELRSASSDQNEVLGRFSRNLSALFDRLRHSHACRYMCVRENHKDGTPHWHALIHEGARKLRYRDLRRQWALGFFHAKLVGKGVGSSDACRYVAKYTTKADVGRIRASRAYGTGASLARVRTGAGTEVGPPSSHGGPAGV